MELIIVAAIFLMLAGLAGCFIPGLPGAPLSYIALILIHISEKYDYSNQLLVIYFIAVIIVVILDYVLPIIGSKFFGATRRGFWGSIIGLVLGVFFLPPLGIIIGPFLGAVIAEVTGGMETKKALRAGVGTFIGFLTGTFVEFVLCIFMAYHLFAKIL